MFTGFPEETIPFFIELRFHNYAEWFHENHERYRRDVVMPFYSLIEDLAPTALKADPGMEIRPHKCLCRINRDIRFSKDKSPYRDHLWFVFRHAAEPREGSLNYWFEFGADTISWGLGYWGENREAMEILRRRMAAEPEEYLELIRSCRLEERGMSVGGSFRKKLELPPELPPELIPWYRGKELYIQRNGIQFGWAFEPELKDRIRGDWEACIPLYRMLRGFWETAEQSK